MAAAVSGCGNKESANAAGSSPTATAQASSTDAGDATDAMDEYIADPKSRTPDEKNAACEALRYAKDANIGSRFMAEDIKVAGGWACVAVEETGVPPEEAVGFGVYLRRQDDGDWEVAETGNGISPDDLPGAPSEIFE